MLISLLLVCFAGFCNSVMDTISFKHSGSVFENMKDNTKYALFLKNFFGFKWWKQKYHEGVEGYGRAKWTIKLRSGKKLQYNIPVQVADGWHFCKALMIICLLIVPFAYKPWLHPLVDYCLLGISFNLTFRLFFHTILRFKN